MSYKIAVIVEKDSDGYYAYCPELEGCQSQGDSLDEIMANIREAIQLYLKTLSDDERAALERKEILTASVEVEVEVA